MDKSAFNKRLGLLIRKKRIEKGYTQLELADKMNLDYQYISRIERGMITPTVYWLLNLSEALEISISQLMLDLEEEKN
jgi:transcriptional regulator with XRE-family HTH domain